MADLLQIIVSGTAVGAIYALCALGFTLLWQASGTINFAQGEFVMVPAFLMLFCLKFVGMPLWLAFAVAGVFAMLILGAGFKVMIVDPLLRHGVIPLVLATLGLSIGLKAFYAAIIGGFNQTRGALLGGVLVGVLENLVGHYIAPAYKEGVALMLFLVVILVRPEGLLGKTEERKV